MRLPEIDAALLTVIVAGATVKLMTSKRLTKWGAVVSAFTAIFTALVFTDAVASLLGATESALRYAIAAMLALTGEGLVRIVIDTSNDPKKLLEWLRAWRGK
jgi:hypothetical protein